MTDWLQRQGNPFFLSREMLKTKLSAASCSNGENLICDWHIRCPENHFREHQMTCGPSRVTGRVRGRIGGLGAVAMATFSLLWGVCSTIPLVVADPVAAVPQLILKTTSRRQSREQRGPSIPLQENIFLINHMIVEKEYLIDAHGCCFLYKAIFQACRLSRGAGLFIRNKSTL